jgi:hypothetical protein
VESPGEPKQDPRSSGFDAAADFAPDFSIAWPRTARQRVSHHIRWRMGKPMNWVMKYEDLVAGTLARLQPSYRRFPSVCPSWDNSARARGGALILRESTPERFERWVAATVASSPFRGEEDLLFVNAWNEWAEGAHLEPDLRFGHGWLEGLRRGIEAGNAERANS